jgi:hypothetical protein
MDDERRHRAMVRQSRMILRKTVLQAQEEDLSPVYGAEALSLVHRLTQESWALSGRVLPGYTREQTPYRFVLGRTT